MAKADIDFTWGRARYELARKNTVIRRRGTSELYSPLRMETLPFEFARLDGSPEECLRFCQLFGFLKMWPDPKGDEETISLWRDAIALVKSWITDFAGGVTVRDPQGKLRTGAFYGVNASITQVNVGVGPNPSGSGSRRLILKPPDLLSAMLLQIAAASAIASCQQCGHFFDIGGEGRRVIAKFCSDECRNRHNYEKRRAGK
jgi:hypothetical protein